MAKRDEVFPSKYLKASDLNGKPVAVTVESATLETLKSPEGVERPKTVLTFKGAQKQLVVNMTNWDAIADIAGDDTDDWPGAQIELYATRTQMGGKLVDCIRVRPPAQGRLKPALKTAKAAEPTAATADDLDDAIPF